MSFQLDERLANDTMRLGHTQLNEYLWMNDSQYPWAILVPRRVGLREVFELESQDRVQMQVESDAVAKLMQNLFSADKMNVAALGNIVQQLHVHHIARFNSDKSWPAPIWGRHPALPYRAEEWQTMKQWLVQHLQQAVADFQADESD